VSVVGDHHRPNFAVTCSDYRARVGLPDRGASDEPVTSDERTIA